MIRETVLDRYVGYQNVLPTNMQDILISYTPGRGRDWCSKVHVRYNTFICVMTHIYVT